VCLAESPGGVAVYDDEQLRVEEVKDLCCANVEVMALRMEGTRPVSSKLIV
jgi:hypothetical protein